MTKEELIKHLKECRKNLYCKNCVFYKTCPMRSVLISDAADALEAADKTIEDLEVALAAYKSIEGQLTKEGEWLRNDKEQDGFDDVVWRYAKCTVCGDSRFSYYAARKNFRYCPNCGAKMKGANDGEN